MKKPNTLWYKAFLPHLVLVVLLYTGCGTETEEDARDKFVGSWTCQETIVGSTEPPSSFPISISKDAGNASRVIINNFNNLADNAKPYAVITGNSVSIPQQTIQLVNSNDVYNVNGSGSYNATASTVSLTYTVNDGLNPVTFNAVLN